LADDETVPRDAASFVAHKGGRMSIFSRLRKRDSDDPGAAAASAGAKAPSESPPPKPAATTTGDKPSAPRDPQPKAVAAKAPAAGTTRAYPAAKPGAPRPVVASAVQARTLLGMPNAAAVRGAAPHGEDDEKAVRGAVSVNGATPAKAANAANGAVTVNGVLATAAGGGTERRSPVTPKPALDEAAPDRALSAPGSIDLAFESLFTSDRESPAATRTEGTSTADDRKAVMATFEELAVGHTAPLRSFMLEVRWGEAQTSWIALARPALKSLRAMASQVEHATLPGAIDAFDNALAELLRPGAPSVVASPGRETLLAAYAPLVAAMPRAFELDGERDRREPVVVRALLEQVPGLEPLMVDRMIAAGLGRLEALYQAKGDEIAVVSDVPADVAAATVERVQAFRRATPAALAAPDSGAAAHELRALIGELSDDQREFETAARGWSEADRAAKRRTRRKRDVDFARVTIALARLGEVDLALHLPKVPFQRRLEELDALTQRLASTAPAYDMLEIDNRTESGAPAAP
jgi:hypothetical protein